MALSEILGWFSGRHWGLYLEHLRATLGTTFGVNFYAAGRGKACQGTHGLA